MIKLGDSARDVVSGFSGIVTGKAEYLFCVDKICLEPELLDSNGQPVKPAWFEADRVSLIVKKTQITGLSISKKTGGEKNHANCD